MDRSEVLKSRIRAHPAFRGGPPDEGYCLDFLESVLAGIALEGLDPIADLNAAVLERHPEKWGAYIAASEKDLLAYKTVQVLLRNLRRQGSVEGPVQEWAYDVAEGLCTVPTGGPDQRKKMLRNAAIIATVKMIGDVSGIPYEFDEPRSGEPRTACHVVADRLGMKFATVRTIWRNGNKDALWDRVQELGVPRPRRKGRSQTP